ncbi:DUF2509 family protein [Enterobacter cloacae]|uniref:DUF2509 family protein n=1 Tax=Enterobacter cloacae subsp. cloacae TaxID=336306 RepID=A0AAE2EF06_ENTCL|nr:DUF2509 family protein [Enterobacter cloacae]SSH33748.1 Protein of uncharacterised function (DUF2509) [Klebsiella pneumoniae]EMC9751784.1 DUF2509 family protein [Enterobacter cloacae]KJM40189.1 hypothetical protein SS44_05820 [Enterobacter cloacae subsp. cloacae]KTH93884.1 hypothetical protein ASV16_10325 [Enterobacter cloacae subsp. cloacae]MCC1992921.1 DUF2509 family protein [Enterobacter cloacae]
MNRQNGIASLTLVLLLLVLGTLILTGLNQQLITFTMLVGDESRAIQQQAATQSALEWGRVQHWSLQPDVQCKQRQTQRVCLRVLNESQVLLIAGDGELLLWRGGEIVNGHIRFLPHGWSDFCPLKERALCRLP